MEFQVSAENLSAGYGGVDVLKNITFSVKSGDYLCIVGENGSGKSTLIGALLGIIKPSGGAVRYTGLLKSEIGYMPQQTAMQSDFPASVWEVVLSGTLNPSTGGLFYSKIQKSIASENLKKLNIADLKNKPYSELSGGQKQRALLARALCAAKKLMVLDEPTAALDPVAAADFYNMLLKLNRENGTAIIVVSHNYKQISQDVSEFMSLKNGIEFYGTPDEFFQFKAKPEKAVSDC